MTIMRRAKSQYSVLIRKTEKKTQLGRPRHRWEDNTRVTIYIKDKMGGYGLALVGRFPPFFMGHAGP